VRSQQGEGVDLKQDGVEEQVPGCRPMVGVLLQTLLQEILEQQGRQTYVIIFLDKDSRECK